MHLSSTRFDFNPKTKCFVGYCGDFNPQIPVWSNLQLRTINPEKGIYLYHNGDIIRFSLYETNYDKSKKNIISWELIPLPEDKSDYPFIRGSRIILLNEFRN